MARLKVFCTTSGFHDSIVAAPSRPAALKAWGARTDLFSMGVARQVTDSEIVKKAMARPGEVIRLGRSGGEKASAPKKKTVKPRTKPPSRSKLVAAEKRLEDLEHRHAAAVDAIERDIARLDRKRDQLRQHQAKAKRAAESKVDDARADYEAALDGWNG